jgi:hypothetical protein
MVTSMRAQGFIPVAAGLAFMFMAAAPARAVVLVEDGVAKAKIVVPDDAWPTEKEAAKELAFLVKKASGATLPVVKSRSKAKDGRYVLIGRAA